MKKMLIMAAKAVHMVSNLFAWISAAVLFFMASVSFVDVIGRYFFHHPLTGAQEIIEVSRSIFVYTGLALAIKLRRCIAVPVIVERLSPRIQLLVTAVGNALCCGMSGLLIWQLALSSAKQLARSSVGTPVLKIPYGPFYAIALVGYVLIALELLILVITDLHDFICWNSTRNAGVTGEEGTETCK